MEVAENVSGDERACHVHLEPGVDSAPFEVLGHGLVGLSAQDASGSKVVVLHGTPVVSDEIQVSDVDSAPRVTIARDVRAFFQGNRFLLERLVWLVAARVPQGPVVDLYAGVGLFGLALAARGNEPVAVVEGDSVSGADLARNARPYGSQVRVVCDSVEAFLGRSTAGAENATVILDPPRTGLSRRAVDAIIARRPPRLIYVSCDVATFARDARRLVESGYALESLVGLDLFPNTAHVESVAVFTH
jgi:23S rRNA (uracil1939-C5)-methyltransferase